MEVHPIKRAVACFQFEGYKILKSRADERTEEAL